MQQKIISLFFFFSLCFLFTSTAQAASGSYGWTYGRTVTGGGTGNDWGGQGVSMDSSGNVFVTGGFEYTVDFDDTGGTDEHTANGSSSADIYITKYNSNGSYGWTKTFGGSAEDYGIGIATDPSGNIFVTGYFQGTADFDASASTDSHTAGGGADIFITKYNSDGSYGWTRTIGSTGNQFGYGIATDTDGNAIVVGVFSGTINFDATGGTDNHASTDGNIFITKYNSGGTYGWTQTFGKSSGLTIYHLGVATDSEDYVYATGSFIDSADFDGSSGTDNHISNGDDDIFISRYSSDGTYKWTKTIGGTGADRGEGITTDPNGYILVTGYFSGTVNFDTDGGTDSNTSAGGKDIFISKFKVNGTYVWTKTIGSSEIYDEGMAVDVDDSGNIFVTGLFDGTVDFDDSGGTDNLTSGPGGDAYITKYNADSSYGWTRKLGGTTSDDSVEGLSIVADPKEVYITGFYTGTVDFNGTTGTDNNTSSTGNFDFFVTSYTDDVPDISGLTTNPASDSSDVAWTTDPAASTQMEYGLTQYFGDTTTETDTTTRVTSHSETVSGLQACAHYYYRVLSTDADSNKGISSQSTFNTSGCLASSVTTGTGVYSATTGGSLDLTNGLSTATLLAPDGFYSEGATFQINVLDSSGLSVTPSGTSLVRGNFYNLLAVSDSDSLISSFDEPVVFTINYGSGIESSFSEGTIDLYKYDGSNWNKQNCTLNTVNNTISCSLGSFSVYGVFGQAATSSSSSGSASSSAPGCSNEKPVGWPDLFQINTTRTTATLYYAPAHGSLDRYYIAYGTNKDNLQHGVEYTQGYSSGVLSYTINHLTPNTTYYFRIRAGNGCMPGDWDGLFKAKTTSSSTRKYFRYCSYPKLCQY